MAWFIPLAQGFKIAAGLAQAAVALWFVARSPRTLTRRAVKRILVIVAGFLWAAAAATVAHTQSTAATSALPPGTIFDNTLLRVRRIKKEPRQMTPAHHVPPLLQVFLTPVHNRVTLADGSTQEEAFAAGAVAWWGGGDRAAENLENEPQEFLTVWVKEAPSGSVGSTLPVAELSAQNPAMAQAMIFDNDRLRVTRMEKAPHVPSKLHDAPGRLLVFLTGGHLRCTFPNQPAIDNVVKAGDVAWWPAGMHVSENVGEQEVRFFLIIPKFQNYKSAR